MVTIFPTFVRRRNRDSSVDSICTRCFQTIASVDSDEELATHEEKHICDPYGEFSSICFNPDKWSHEVRPLQAPIQYQAD